MVYAPLVNSLSVLSKASSNLTMIIIIKLEKQEDSFTEDAITSRAF